MANSTYIGDLTINNPGLDPADSREYSCGDHTWDVFGEVTRYGFRPFGRQDICKECGEQGEEVEVICNGCGGSGKRGMEMMRKCLTCGGGGVLR